MNGLEYAVARKAVRLANLISTKRNADIKEMGLTAAQADALVFFAQNAGSTVSYLKDDLGVTHQTASGIVERMIKKDLLTTRVSQEDARCRAVYLTEQGERIHDRFLVNGSRTGGYLLCGMDERQREEFLALLTRAAENLETVDTDAEKSGENA